MCEVCYERLFSGLSSSRSPDRRGGDEAEALLAAADGVDSAVHTQAEGVRQRGVSRAARVVHRANYTLTPGALHRRGSAGQASDPKRAGRHAAAGTFA
jgi:hypothetical protein